VEAHIVSQLIKLNITEYIKGTREQQTGFWELGEGLTPGGWDGCFIQN